MVKNSAQRAFSLLELSVAIAVIALLMGAGIGMGSTALKAADRVTTQERLATIKAALEQYARMNYYLPCPANRSMTPAANSADFGREIRPCAASGAGLVRVNGAAGWIFIGMAPVRALGLPDEYAEDAWGNKFLYAVSETAITDNPDATPAIAVYGGDRMATNYALSSVTDRAVIPNTAAAITPGYGATYVVVSHGPNGNGAYPLNATTFAVPCNNGTGNENDLANCDDSDAIFYDTEYNDVGATNYKYYDDYIVWGSNALQRAPINTAAPPVCASGCDAWCAPCTTNQPTGAPGSMTAGTARICKKIITSTSPCQSACLWGGTISAGGARVRCP